MSQHFKPRPTHVCKLCGASWKYHEDGGLLRPAWQLVSDDCGPCCDNVTMGAQIVAIPATEDDRYTEPPDGSHGMQGVPGR